jgi:hypothetical protein
MNAADLLFILYVLKFNDMTMPELPLCFVRCGWSFADCERVDHLTPSNRLVYVIVACPIRVTGEMT